MTQKDSPDHDEYPEDKRAAIAQDLVRIGWARYGWLYRRAVQDAEDEWEEEGLETEGPAKAKPPA